MANSLWWTAKQRCKKNRHQEHTSAVESKVCPSHSLWSLVEKAANSFEKNTVQRIAEEIRLCKELILFWAEELRLQKENNLVRTSIRSLKRTVHTLQDNRHKMRMEINDLAEQVVNSVEMAEAIDRNIDIDRRGETEFYLNENLANLNYQDADKMQDATAAISISQIWSQCLQEGEPHKNPQPQKLPTIQKPPNTNTEAPPEQMDDHVKEVHPDESRERLSPKSPNFSPNSKIKDGSLSETMINSEGSIVLAAQHVKSAILESAEKNPMGLKQKPDVVLQDREISGYVENTHQATNEIMSIIENEVLYHIFPVQVIGNDLGQPKNSGSNPKPEQAGASGAQTHNQSLISMPSETHSKTSVSSENRKRDQDTIETYMHYVYGQDVTPRTTRRDETDELSPRKPSDFTTFVVSGEELLPRFDIVGQPMNKKSSDNSLSSGTTEGSSDIENESKEMLILDLSIDNPNVDNASALSYAPLSDNPHSSEFTSDSSRSAISNTDDNKRVHKRRSLQKLYMKSKTIRSTPQKMKKFFCFTVS